MEADRAVAHARGRDRMKTRAAAHGTQRRAVGAAQRFAVVRPAGALRAVALELSPLQRLAPQQGLQGDPRGAADAARRGGSDRLGLWCVDGSTVRASRAAAGAGKQRAPMSLTTTPWAARAADSAAISTWLLRVADAPLAVHVTAGQINESSQFEAVVNRDHIPTAVGTAEKAPGGLRLGQGLQLPAHPRLAAPTLDPYRDPAALRSTPRRRAPPVRPAALSPPLHHRAVRGLAQGVPPAVHPVREAGLELHRTRPSGRVLRHSLARGWLEQDPSSVFRGTALPTISDRSDVAMRRSQRKPVTLPKSPDSEVTPMP